MPGKLNAGDVLNMEYLRGIARDHDLAYSTDPRRALEIFAYEIVEAAGTEEQNRILRELLARMTSGHSRETNKDVLKYLAMRLNSHLYLLTEFAKQEGMLI